MYLAVSGNIGSGKSSLTGLLAERYALAPVFEAVDDNPYLEDFYADLEAGRPGRYAFHSQVFFLARRLEQHLGSVNPRPRVIQDRTVFEDAAIFARNLFASGQLDGRDWETYTALYGGIAPALRTPGLLLYLRCSLPTLRARIEKRGRSFEQGIPDEYLGRLNALYEEWIAAYRLGPVLVVPGDELDFVADPGALGWVCRELEARGLDRPVIGPGAAP